MTYADEQLRLTTLGSRADAEIAQLTNQITALQGSLSAAAVTITARDATIAQLRADVAEGEAEIAAQENLIADLRAQLKAATTPSSAPPLGDPDDGPWTPQSYPNAAAAVTALGLPTDANYVTWKPEWDGKMLEEVFTLLGSNDVLVLPERDEPYLVDTSEGFRAAGVSAIQGRNGWIPVVNRFQGRTARTWFALCRARRGVLGLGPRSVIALSQSGWLGEQQIKPKGKVVDGWTSPGRFYKNLDGSINPNEQLGCQEKVMEFEHATPIAANFVMRGRDLGGIAYSAISTNRPLMARRIIFDAAHRGFSAVPNGEAGGIACNGAYDWKGLWIGTRDPSGARVGSSPFMVNNSAGGIMEDIWCEPAVEGMPTLWNCSGTHTLNRVWSAWNKSHGLNLEKCQPGMVVNWTGGRNVAFYQGQGGMPSPDGKPGTGMHFGVNADKASIKINCVDVVFDNTGPTAGAVNVQSYLGDSAALFQKSTDITVTVSGTRQPVKVYGDAA